jgi:Integrase core domain
MPRANNAFRKHHFLGYGYLHSAVDDHSRLAYSEILSAERKETAFDFWQRAQAWSLEHGITVEEVLTDNGSCYRSRLFDVALGDIKHRKTRPYRPQTNGKVERVQPHHARRMGLREDLLLRVRAQGRLQPLLASLQSSPQSYGSRGPAADQSNQQPACSYN